MPILPKLNVIYFKNLIDRCFVRFFSDKSDSFVRQDDGTYVFSSSWSKRTLEKMFTGYLLDELDRYTSDYVESSPEYFFIIGSCTPVENFALDFANISKKLSEQISEAPDIRYFLKESDIVVDMRLFNDVFESIFIRYMKKKYRKNVFFIRHRNLDCYFTFKLLKHRYGSLVVNLHKMKSMGEDRCIYSVNEEIDRFCSKKLELLKSSAISPIRDELYEYIEFSLNNMV